MTAKITTTSIALGAAAVLAMSAVPAQASTATVYRGTWDTASFCGSTHAATGTWRIVTRDDEAIVSIAMFLEGEPHAFWGGNKFTVVEDSGSLRLTSASLPFTFALAGDSLTFTVTDYPCGDGATDTAVVTGTVTS